MSGPARLAVTTSRRATPDEAERAEAVAAACDVPLVLRRGRGLPAVAAEASASHVYVVARDAEHVTGPGGKLWVHPSTAQVSLSRGEDDPLLRAVTGGPARPARAIRSVVDATLGLARDALHLASVLGCRVTGVEGAPVLACLAVGGLSRLRRDPQWATAAALVTVVPGRSAEVLAAMPTGSADVVLLDPMFPTPRRAPAGFDVLRAFALHAPPTGELLAQAARVAPRVVLKVSRGEPLPPAALPWTDRVRGRAFEYLVHEACETRPGACR